MSIFFPTYWGINKNKIYCLGQTKDKRYIKYEFDIDNIVYLKFLDTLTLKTAKDIVEKYDCDEGVISLIDDRSIMLKNPNFNELTDTQDWVDSKRNKYGKLYSFFILNEIRPHKWIKYEDEKLDQLDDNTNISIKNMYWDIEVNSTKPNEFPDPNIAGNEIIFISAVVEDRINEPEIYLLYLGSIGSIVNEEIISGMYVNYVFFENEFELIKGFYNLLAGVSPDFIYGYNDASFDYDYLYYRSKLYSLNPTNITKVPGMRSYWRERVLKTKFGNELRHQLVTPGMNQIDMLYYVRRYLPGLPNHKLETVSSFLLGKGKTGLKISDMMRYYQTQDPVGMRLAALYSIQDSVLLRDLAIKLDMQKNIIHLSNMASDTMDRILENSSITVLNKILGSYDFTYLFGSVKKKYVEKTVNIESMRVYTDIYVYDPKLLYSNALKEQGSLSPFGYELDYLPSEILEQAYHSDIIESYIKYDNLPIIDINKYTIFASEPIDNKLFVQLYIYKKYVQFNTNNYFAMPKGSDQEIIRYGQSSIMKPNFGLAIDYVNEYINYLFGVSTKVPSLPTNYGIEKLQIHLRVKKSSNYKNKKLYRYILSYQYEQFNNITTWVEIKAYKIDIDPGYVISDLFNASYPIDLKYYTKILTDYHLKFKYITKI